jgi:hypothetical protein
MRVVSLCRSCREPGAKVSRSKTLSAQGMPGDEDTAEDGRYTAE